MDQAGARDVDSAREEGHTEGFLMGNGLEGADEIGALEILGDLGSVSRVQGSRAEKSPYF